MISVASERRCLRISRWVEGQTDCRVFGKRVTGAEAHLESASAEVVEGGELLSEHHRMSEIVIQHEGADLDSAHGARDGGQHGERGGLTAEVVSHVEDVEAR